MEALRTTQRGVSASGSANAPGARLRAGSGVQSGALAASAPRMEGLEQGQQERATAAWPSERRIAGAAGHRAPDAMGHGVLAADNPRAHGLHAN